MRVKRILPNEWENYKYGIIFIEQQVFAVEGEFIDSPEYIERIAKNPKAVFIIAEENNIIVGDTYGSLIEDRAHFESDPEDLRLIELLKRFPTFGKNSTTYVASTAILPEFRKRGFAIKLKKIFVSEAKNSGYKFMTGFVNKASLNLNLRFGARVVHTLPNWIGNQTYYQYYIKF